MSQNLQNFVKFQKFQLENRVDFEKCCKTHIFLQKSEPIQPKTSNILPKFCKPTLTDVGWRRPRHRTSSVRPMAYVTKICKFSKFSNFWLARSRLYQNEFLQENMRSTAFFKLYKICILLHRCNLKIFAKNRFEKSTIFVKFQQKIANVAKSAKFCQISKISAR